MKKRTVITIVFAALLCLAFLGMDPAGVNAEGQMIQSSNVIGSHIEQPVPVTFSEAGRRTTLYLGRGESFGEHLPALPTEGTWQWTDAEGNVLNAETTVEAPLTVYAAQTYHGEDFLNGVAASLFATDSNSPYDEGALIASKSGDDLKACITTKPGCQPSVWSFEFVGCTTDPKICKYFVSSGGSYLNVSSAHAWLTETKPGNPLYIKNNGDTYLFMNKNNDGALNFKKDIFKGTKKDYFSYAGSQIYFAPKKSAELLTLSFSVNGGDLYPGPVPVKVAAGTAVKLPSYSGTKNTHAFSGWSAAAAGDPLPEVYVMPDADTTLYAVYSQEPILWLDLNGGEGTLEKYSFRSDESPVTLPGAEQISREGYKFIGWSPDEFAIAGDEDIFEAGTAYPIPESGDTILYAVWQNSVSVYAAASLKDEPVYIGAYETGEEADLTEALAGFDFSTWFYYGRNDHQGWYRTGEKMIIPEHDVILYGANYVKIHFDANDGSGRTFAKEHMLTGETISLPEINAHFNSEDTEIFGWEEVEGGTVYTDTYTAGQDDENLKAVWKYTVSFDIGAGSQAAPAGLSGFIGDGQVLPAYEGKNNGKYDFIGWITVPLSEYVYGQTHIYHPGDSLFDEDGELPRAAVCHALYQVPVNFDPNNGTSVEGPVVKNNKIWTHVTDPGIRLDLAEFTAAGRANRVFLGWAKTTENQEKISAYVVPAEESTFYAVWGSTITFANTWFTGLQMPPAVTGFQAAYVASAEPYKGTWVAPVPNNQNGHILLGWSRNQGSTDVHYKVGTQYDFPQNNATYYAVWGDYTTIVFDANGGEGGTLPAAVSKQTGEKVTMPGDCGMTREGYTFGGWSKVKNLYAGYNEVYYGPETDEEGNIIKAADAYEVPMYPSAKTTFFAIWNKNTGRPPLKFGIYLEKGQILTEPVASGKDYDAKLFTTNAGKRQDGSIDWNVGNILVDDALINQHWVVDRDEITKPPAGQHYLDNAVTAAIDKDKLPSAADIDRILKAAGVEEGFDPDTEYVVWYVVKYKTDAKLNGQYCWHVDGTILKRNNVVNLRYVHGEPGGNLPSSEMAKWSLPSPKQYLKDAEVTVAQASSPTPNAKLNGYSFMYWVDRNGQIYMPGARFNIDGDMVLYSYFSHNQTDISVEKIWKDGGHTDLRPTTVTMDLFADGKKASEFPNGVTFSGTGDRWVEEVQAYENDSSGKPITYTWQERVPEGYSAGYSADTKTVTNTMVVSSTVTKIWSDGNENHADDRVTVILMQGLEGVEGETSVDSVVLSAENDWTHTTTGLPKFDENSKAPYVYHWVESGISSAGTYETTTDDGNNNTTITNRRVEIPITITAPGDTWVYDGTEHILDTFDQLVITDGELDPGDSLSALTITGSQTVVGTSSNVPSDAVITNADNIDVTGKYKITYVNGTLEVTKKAVTVTADSDTKIYDGTALVKDSYTNTELGSDDTIESVTMTGSQTVVGSSANVPSAAKIVNAKGEDVTSSYTIDYVNGTLAVTKKAVTITAGSDTKVYDGTALKKNSYTNTALAAGERIGSVVVTGSQIVAGISENVPSAAKIVNADDEDMTANYDIDYAKGTLEVLQKSIIITANSRTEVYNGSELKDVGWKSSALAADSEGEVPAAASDEGTDDNTDGLASGDSIDSVTVTGSQTVVGTSNNVPSEAKIVNAQGTDVTASYKIDYENGTLEITKKGVTVTADSDTKVYDGTALTNDGYTHTDLAEGDSIESVTVSGSQTVVGTSKNVPSAAKIVNAAGEDVTGNYEITYADGTLEITQKAVTVTAASDSKVYDGTALSKDGYTNTELVSGDSIESVSVTGSQTVVGTSKNVPSAAKIVNAAGEDVTGNYVIAYANGILEVTKKAVTITADGDTKVYDGTALTKDSYTNSALAASDSIESVTVTGSQTVVGTSNNVPSAAKIVNAAGEDVTGSYEISYANGTLEVTQKEVTVTADSDTKVYDGTALTKDSYTNTALAEGDSIETVTVTGSQTVADISDNVPSAAKIVNADGEDVTASYKITYENGTLEVTQKEVTVTSGSDTKVYDGTALTDDSYTNTDLAAGDSIETVTVAGSQTVAGTSDNVPSAAKIVNADGEDVTESYDITYANGTLEVTRKALTITADGDTKIYDGTALTKNSYTNTDLAAGDSVDDVTVTGSQTVAGTSNNIPSAAKIVNAAGKDVTASYEISYANGTLEVTKKAVTITADGDEKGYDGTALTKNSYTNTDLAAGDSIDSVTVTGSQTVVGTSDNVPSEAVIKNAGGADVTASYEVTYANGTLEITKKDVTVTADSGTKVYDGTALTKDSYTNTALAAGDSIETVTVTGSQTVVGTSDNVPSEAVIVNAAGEDVTESYEITYAKSTLEVTKKAVTITADSGTKVYDGTALTKDSYTNTALATGDSIDSVTVTGSQTVVGSTDNVPSEAKIVNAAGEDVTASYEITYANGTLEVTKKAVTVTADTDTKVYDGTALTKDSYTNTDLAAGDSIETVTVTGSQTVVGSTDNVPSEAKIVNAAGEDVTSSYEITYANGSLSVTVNRSAVITADSGTKVYDGTALTKDSYQVAGLAVGDSVESVTVTGSQTVVGTSDNVPSAVKIVNAAGEDVTASYEVAYANGTLEITKKSVTVTADTDTKGYDGTALTKDSYTNTGLAEGDSIDSVTVTGSQTVVGTSDNVLSAAKIVNAAGEEVTESYEISYANGTLEVTQKILTVTADSDTKVYDGTALAVNSYTNTDLAAGDSFESVTVTGSQTVVGSSDNVPSAAKIVNTAGEDVTASYAVTYVNGTLEVTQKTLTVTADSDTKVYDGTALAVNSYTNTDLAEGDSIDSVTVTGSRTVVGSSDNVPSAAKIVNADGADVTASYQITYTNGTLEVTQKEVTITADSDTKTYDGTALTKNSYTNTDLAAGDSIESVTVTGSRTVLGISDNVPSAAKIVNAAGEDVTASYKITYANGTLEVTKKTLTVTADSDEKVYDGTALTKNSYTNTDLAAGDSIESVTVTGSQTVVGTSNNVPSAAVIRNTAGDDVTASYDITYTNGTLEVTKKAVTVTADSGSKVYDASALTKDSYTNTELASGDKVESVTVTGSRTVLGISDNVPSGAKIVNAAGADVTASYDITYANGTLEVTQKAVTVTADSDTKIYDGTALTKDSYTNTALAAGDSIETVTVTGSRTVVGTSDNVPSGAKIVNAAGDDVTASYEIGYANGTLEVTKMAVTVTADSDTKVYDGTALTKDSYTNTALAAGDSIESVTVTGSQTVVGSIDNVPSEAVIKNAGGEDVTASYAITYANGTLEVTKKAVTITADSDTKVYDGTALTKDSYTNTALAAGDSIETVTVTGSQTVIGTSDNIPSEAVITNAAGEDVTASYEITYANGTLEVTKKAVTVTADSDTKVYDGTALTKDSYTNTALAAGDSFDSVTVTGSQTVVGSSDNVPSGARILNTAGDDVTASYEITYKSGTLEVTKKAVTITADSDTKVYDGTALTKNSYINTTLAAGDSFDTVTVTGSQTVVGTSDNIPSEAVIVNAAGEDVTASYEITYANGSLSVTVNRSAVITADSDTKVYDGTALTKDSYQAAGLAAGDSVESVTVTGSQTVVGTSDNVPSGAKIVNAAGDDVTSSYEVTYTNGTLEVTKKAVTITADSDTKVYDGSALTKDSYTNTDLAAGDSIDSVTVTGSQTVVGTSNNVPSAASITNTDGEDVTASYEITYKSGTLEVTKKAVTITADSDTKVYDGTALTKDSYTSTDLAAGDSFESVTVTGSQTLVGTSDNVPSEAKIVNAANEDVTASYEITYANGTLAVTKKAVTITADSDTKVYDGTALTKDSYTNTALAAGDGFDSVTVTGSQTVVGTSNNVPSEAKIVNAAGEDVTASYEITYANGTLEVTKKAVTITADSDTKVYDGTALEKNSYTNSDLAAGDSFGSVTVTGSQTVAGTSDNVPSAAKIVNAAGEDVTASYNITYANGTLEVTPKTLTVTADSDEIVYNGIALKMDSFTNTDLAAGDTLTAAVTGSQTVVGTSKNIPSGAKVVNAAGEDVTASYNITYANGTLEVTPKALTVTAGSGTKVYDGTALTKNSYTNTELAAGDSIEFVTVTGTQTVVGTSTNTASDAVIVNAEGVNVTASYSITYVSGTLEVMQKALTITADSDTKVYDGTALTKNSYANTELASGDSISSVTVTGSQTIVGSSDNVPSAAVIVNAAGENVASSYNITYANGTLEVTPKAVTVTADSDIKVYDGTALMKDSYTNTDLGTGDSIDSVTVTGSQTVVGTSNNVLSEAVIMNAAGEDVTASYNITYASGTLEVTKKAVTVTADSDTKVYDGIALTKDSYTNTTLAAGDSFESVTVSGSQTASGTANNVPSEAVIVNAAGEDVTASYEITYANGTLAVTKKPVTITAVDDTKVYDAAPLRATRYITPVLADGDSIASLNVTGSQTVVGSSANVPSDAVIRNAAGEDVTASYDITYVNGTLSVTVNRAVIITAGSDTKVYDGTALTWNRYHVKGLAEGDRVDSVTVTGSQTVYGTSANVPSGAKIVNAAGEDVTSSYEVTYANGSLIITKTPVTVTADSDTKVYDGAALTKDSYTNTALAEGDSIETVTVTGSQTVFGSTSNVPSAAVIKNAAGDDVTDSYEITYANGTLEVTKKALTITANSDTKVYDGTALTKKSYTNTALAVSDSIASVTVTGSQIVVGSSANVPSAAKIVNARGMDVTASYEITYKSGTLEVTPKAVTVTADSYTKVYDGTALTKNSFTNSALAEGDSITSVVTGSQTIVGSSANVPSAAVIKNAAGEDVTASYAVTYVNGKLEVTPKAVTVTADSSNKVYDGTALTWDSYWVDGLAGGDSIGSVKVNGSRTLAGISDNVPSEAVIVNAAGEDVTASYEITYVNGTLEVLRKTIFITADSETKVYDGTALTNDGFTSSAPAPVRMKKASAARSVPAEGGSAPALAEGDIIESVTVTGMQTFIGESANVARNAVITNAAGEDVTNCYEIIYNPGTLTVTRLPVTIIADSGTSEYNGEPYTNEGYSNTPLAEGDSISSITLTGEQITAGTSENNVSDLKITNKDGVDVTANYEIIIVSGKLTVTRKTVTITAGSKTKVYDGTALTNNNYTKDGLVDGDRLISLAVTGSQTAAGISANVPSAAKIVRTVNSVNDVGESVTEEKDVTLNYNVKYVNGTLEVTQKALTITAGSDTKVYDGTALTMTSYTGTALAEGDSIGSVTVTGSQTLAGSSENVPSAAKIVSKDAEGTETDVTDNYQVNYVNGTLEVTKKALTITAGSDTKVYDGTALTSDVYSRTEELADGDRIESVTVTGSLIAAGEAQNVPSDAKIVNGEGDNVTDVTESYSITYKNGSLKVEPKPIFITADSETGVYNGQSLHKDSYTTSELAAGDRIDSITVDGSRIQAGTSPNEVKDVVILNGSGEEVNDSYTISYIKGTLTVFPAPVTVTADSFKKEYGQLDVPFTAKVTGLLEGEDISLITYELSREEGEEPGEYVITPSGEEIQGNYSVSYLPGKLTITWNPTTFSVEKVWADDNNRDGIRPVSLGVKLTGSDGSSSTYRLSDANGWKVSVEDLPIYYGGQPVTYAWSEEEVPGYTGSSEVLGNVTIFTNTHAITRTTASVTKIWDDRDNAGHTRPDSLGVILFSNGEKLFGRTLSDENSWTITVDNLPMYEKGKPVNYVWNEQSAGNGYYAVRSTASGGNTTLVNSNLYTMKIRYTYADGSEAAPDYVDRLGFGETFVVDSPVRAGYTAGQASVVGMMPSHDVEFKVIYTREGEATQRTAVVEDRKNTDSDHEGNSQKDIPQVPEQMVADAEHPFVLSVPTYHVDIDEYGTALGLGEVNMTSGGTFSFE